VVEEHLSGRVIGKDGSTPCASVHHVVASAWEVNSGSAGHVGRYTRQAQGPVVSRFRTVGTGLAGNATHMTPFHKKSGGARLSERPLGAVIRYLAAESSFVLPR
jgi:hypothetical protein